VVAVQKNNDFGVSYQVPKFKLNKYTLPEITPRIITPIIASLERVDITLVFLSMWVSLHH
jgi:hypothetical protein